MKVYNTTEPKYIINVTTTTTITLIDCEYTMKGNTVQT